MKTALLGLTILATSAAAAAGPTYASLSKTAQSTVQQKLAKWKRQFGALAQAEGFVPTSQESIQVNGHSLDELERFHNTIVQVQEAAKLNPHATFSENNVFALVTLDEFKQYLQKSFAGRPKARPALVESVVAAPSAVTDVDWTNSTCNSPVRSQGACGSCWAFSTVAAVESAHCLATGQLLDLAEQQLVSCSTRNYGCRGGFPSEAIEYMQYEGVCLEEAYPYTSGTTKVNGACTTGCQRQKVAIGEYVYESGEPALLKALVKQPVTVAVEAGNSVWKNYKSGVVTQCPGGTVDHAVVAVASGTSTDDYVKIKNSWGANWGEDGYIYIKRGGSGRGVCKVNQEITYPTLLVPTAAPTTTAATTKPTTTNFNPSTAAPTTAAPTTAAPTTAAPTTAAPTTVSPSTASPTTTSSANVCGTCKTCYFPTNKWCVGSVSKEGCLISTGSVWCGA